MVKSLSIFPICVIFLHAALISSGTKNYSYKQYSYTGSIVPQRNLQTSCIQNSWSWHTIFMESLFLRKRKWKEYKYFVTYNNRNLPIAVITANLQKFATQWPSVNDGLVVGVMQSLWCKVGNMQTMFYNHYNFAALCLPPHEHDNWQLCHLVLLYLLFVIFVDHSWQIG